MKTVYKFEDYTLYSIYPGVLNEVNEKVVYLYQVFDIIYGKDRNLYLPIPNNLKYDLIEPYYTNTQIKYELENPDKLIDKSKLFIHPNCTIPRVKVAEKYTRVIKKEKANFCIIPECKENIRGKLGAIFINKEKSQIFTFIAHSRFVRNIHKHFVPTACQFREKGTKLLDIYPELKNINLEDRDLVRNDRNYNIDTWNNFLNSTLEFYGVIAELKSTEQYIADYVYGELHHVLLENQILSSIKDEENIFNKEIYNSMMEMLNSKDVSIIGLALKTISEFNYIKYHNSILHLLTECSQRWRDNNMKNTVSVKHMLDYLKIRFANIPTYSDKTTQEDFDLMLEIVESDFKNALTKVHLDYLGKYSFAHIDLSCDFKVTPKLIEV
jgi:hypothetical protein